MLMAGATTALLALPPSLGPGGCLNPAARFEPYGPTDVNVQTGNGSVTVDENSAGTITNFRFPNPSLYNLVKYFTTGRNPNGSVRVQYPNEGSFAGIRYRLRNGRTGFAWLGDWHARQQYDSPDTPIPVTVYSSPRRLGLHVTDVDLVPPASSRFVREFWVERRRGSPVSTAWLVYFENFNPVASHIPYLPVSDWCMAETSDQHAVYDRRRRAIVNWWSGVDAATGAPSSVAVAFGFAAGDDAHQVGGDAYQPPVTGGRPADAYDQATRAPHRLGDSDSANGQTDGALEQRLRFDRGGWAEARMTIAAGQQPVAALAALDAGRRIPFLRQLGAVRRDWHGFLARRLLPASGDRRVVDVAKRSLITVRLARVAQTGAIIASANTQGPYAEDWIRDGSFINRLLDLNGLTGWVTQHNLFYARVQTSAQDPGPRPPGNWAMAYYYDGIPGGPIPYEIDETGFGAWTLFDHWHYLHGRSAHRYLAEVYPAIARAADWLATCQDPLTGLQCPASEDDSTTPSETLHGAETVYLGLESAIAAAAAIGDHSAHVALWSQRLTRLRSAIDALYDPSRRYYDNAPGGAPADQGNSAWMLWPVRFKPYRDPSMAGEADTVYSLITHSLADMTPGYTSGYEQKGLLGLAHAWRPFSPAHARELRSLLRYMARSLTTRTGLFGEFWQRKPDGGIQIGQDQPHVWEHTLFYLAAIEIDGTRRYGFAHGGFIDRALRRRQAPFEVLG